MIKPQNKRSDNESRCLGRAQAQLDIVGIAIHEVQVNLERAGRSEALGIILDLFWKDYAMVQRTLERELAQGEKVEG